MFFPSLYLSTHLIWRFIMSCCLSLTPLISSILTPLVCTSMPPPPAYFSVDGDLSRPWLTLAQPPPPLCSLWWWGSLCCDTDAGSADRATDWNTDSPESQTLGKDRGQTDRWRVSKALYKDSLWFFFFLMYILFEKVIVLKLFLCLEVVFPALTQQHWQRGTEHMKRRFTTCHVLSLWGTGTPCTLCSCLPLMTKATVGRELCEGFCGCCQDLTFGHTKSPDHQTALLIHILFTPFEDTTIFVTLQSTCRKNYLIKMYIFSIFFTFFCGGFLLLLKESVAGKWCMDRSLDPTFCIALTFWYRSPSIFIFLLRHPVNLFRHAYSVYLPLPYFSSSESSTPEWKGIQHQGRLSEAHT